MAFCFKILNVIGCSVGALLLPLPQTSELFDLSLAGRGRFDIRSGEGRDPGSLLGRCEFVVLFCRVTCFWQWQFAFGGDLSDVIFRLGQRLEGISLLLQDLDALVRLFKLLLAAYKTVPSGEGLLFACLAALLLPLKALLCRLLRLSGRLEFLL